MNSYPGQAGTIQDVDWGRSRPRRNGRPQDGQPRKDQNDTGIDANLNYLIDFVKLLAGQLSAIEEAWDIKGGLIPRSNNMFTF
jgi:hypothetical protein